MFSSLNDATAPKTQFTDYAKQKKFSSHSDVQRKGKRTQVTLIKGFSAILACCGSPGGKTYLATYPHLSTLRHQPVQKHHLPGQHVHHFLGDHLPAVALLLLLLAAEEEVVEPGAALVEPI